MRQTVCNFLQCNMSKRGDHGTAYESDRWGGGYSIMEKFFLVTRQRPVTSTFCTCCGDWVTHRDPSIAIRIASRNQVS